MFPKVQFCHDPFSCNLSNQCSPIPQKLSGSTVLLTLSQDVPCLLKVNVHVVVSDNTWETFRSFCFSKSSRLLGILGSTIQNASFVKVCINLLSEYMCITDSTCRITIFKKYSHVKAKTFILTKDKFCVSVSCSITSKPKKCCNIQMVIMYSLMRVAAKIDLCTQL